MDGCGNPFHDALFWILAVLPVLPFMRAWLHARAHRHARRDHRQA